MEMLITPTLQQATWRGRLHTVGQNLYFTEAWPGEHVWARGKYFRVTKAVVVPYDKGYILPGNDSKNLNLSNVVAGLKLYPETNGVCYELLIGLAPGHYQIGLYIPGPENFLLALADSAMTPNLADADRRFLAAFTPDDTPAANPLLKLYAINDMAAWHLKLYVREGVDFEKCVLGFKINKLRLEEIAKPANWTTILHANEIKGNW